MVVGGSQSSLLRVMAGLWTSGSGRVLRPTTSEMFFLPQRPYCTLGTLRDQLTYPEKPGIRDGEASDEELLSILDQVRWSQI
jgi:vitamin B12/bleomycin/antimicrobial peptide transport system ATP-binding/permease protein